MSNLLFIYLFQILNTSVIVVSLTILGMAGAVFWKGLLITKSTEKRADTYYSLLTTKINLMNKNITDNEKELKILDIKLVDHETLNTAQFEFIGDKLEESIQIGKATDTKVDSLNKYLLNKKK